MIRSSFVSVMLLAAGCGLSPVGSEGELEGTVRDALSGAPIEGATVRIEGTERVGATDAAGRFALAAPAGEHALFVSSPEHLSLSRAGIIVEEARTTHTDVAIHAQAPPAFLVHEHMDRHGATQADRDDPAVDPALRPEVAAFLRGQLDESELLGDAVDVRGDVAGRRLALGAPPATVRIWRRSIDGASASCSGRIDIIPLEDYVKGVLPHEWIPSWHDASLRAGSLSIRTYVWNWVNRGGKYDCADLDDTTRSQVYRDDRMARTDAAVDATRGQAITRSGAMVSGEYSAENGHPTGDGVQDPLCAGQTIRGHTRGMCQWGSQRWALDGKDHVWIATHYWTGSGVEGGAPVGPAYDAELVDRGAPMDLLSGERAEVWIDMRNTGTATWDLGATRLGTTRPQDHDSPFYDPDNWIGPNRATPPDHSTYATGDIGRFTFMVTAPEVGEPTIVSDTFGLVQEGVTWFGPDDITIEIRVSPRAGTVAPPPGEDPPTGDDPPLVDGGEPPVDPGLTPGGDRRTDIRTLHGSCSAGGGAPGHALPLLILVGAIVTRRRAGPGHGRCAAQRRPCFLARRAR